MKDQTYLNLEHVLNRQFQFLHELMTHEYAIEQQYDRTNPNEIIPLFENKKEEEELHFLDLMNQTLRQDDHNLRTKQRTDEENRRRSFTFACKAKDAR